MRPFIETLPGSRIYGCGSCGCHVSSREALISKTFHGRCGRAFLFERAVNVETPLLEDRALMTGLHSVADAHCTRCGSYLGESLEAHLKAPSQVVVARTAPSPLQAAA